MSLHSALRIVANHFEEQHCPLFDSARQLAVMNVAFCLTGPAKLQSRHPPLPGKLWVGGVTEAMKEYKCNHIRCSDKHFIATARVRTRCVGYNKKGKQRVKVNMQDVRNAVLAAHGGHIGEWIACKCDIDYSHKDKLLLRNVLSAALHVQTLDYYRIRHVWDTCKKCATFVPSFATNSLALEMVKNSFHHSAPFNTAVLANEFMAKEKQLDIIIEEATKSCTSPLLRTALARELSHTSPVSGALLRANNVCSAYMNRPHSSLVRECVDYIVYGGEVDIIDKLRSDEFRVLAALEEAKEYDLDSDPVLLERLEDDIDGYLGLIHFLRGFRNVQREATRLHLELDVYEEELGHEYYMIEAITDQLTGMSAETLLSCRWIRSPNTRYESYNLDIRDQVYGDLEYVREVFDRYANLKDALSEVGIDIDDHLRDEVCRTYIVYHEDAMELEQVVEYMQEEESDVEEN